MEVTHILTTLGKNLKFLPIDSKFYLLDKYLLKFDNKDVRTTSEGYTCVQEWFDSFVLTPKVAIFHVT